jgi:hypothetical protein
MDSFELDRLADDGNPNVNVKDYPSEHHEVSAYRPLNAEQQWANFLALNEAMGA